MDRRCPWPGTDRVGGSARSRERHCPTPHEATIRRVLEIVDADTFDAILAAWLAARRHAQLQPKPTSSGERPMRRAVAVDGKALRGARRNEHHTVHLPAAFDHSSGLVLAQTDVNGKTNEIARFQPLLAGLDLDGYVLTADALHTQREHVTFLVAENNAHYILIVKKNQPSLQPRWRAQQSWRSRCHSPGGRGKRFEHVRLSWCRRRWGQKSNSPFLAPSINAAQTEPLTTYGAKSGRSVSLSATRPPPSLRLSRRI
ncbi:ISAs1 family transposase [Nonomuraea sp. NPDC049750]|uniref:ISAs1 family transposase n=1 Tax=Nonomuraea sp. NPDC049750 TaxID=3154738 RepID=UPI0033C8EC27